MLPRPRRDRTARPARGLFIGFVGPDGSGKTTTAAEVEALCSAMNRKFAYVHWRPSLTSAFGRPDPLATPMPKVQPKMPNTIDRMASLARLLRSAIAFNAAYALRLRPQVRSGSVVVVDRWVYNYITQPNSVRYYGMERVAAFVCCRLVVRPRPVFVFEAPTAVILARSHELTAEEVEAEYERIRRSLRLADVRWIDATASAPRVAAAVLAQCGITEPGSG
jgi:thymidylate kinase